MNSLADSKPAATQLWTCVGVVVGILFSAVATQGMPQSSKPGIDASHAIACGLIVGICAACGWVFGKVLKLIRG